MKRKVLLPLLAGLLASAGQAAPSGSSSGICAALDRLAAGAVATRRGQEVSVLTLAPFEIGCAPAHDAAGAGAFCEAVAMHTSMEFTHVFPWQIHDCLRGVGVPVSIETVAEHTGVIGRAKIVRLSARTQAGVAVEIVYTPEPEAAPDPNPFMRHRYGRYRLTLTPR